MITPRRTRLVRAVNLQAFRYAIGELCTDRVDTQVRPSTEAGAQVRPASQISTLGGADRRVAPLVVVPTRGAAHQLLRALPLTHAGALGDPVTRDQLYDRLHARLPQPPPRLTAPERGVIAHAAAREAMAAEPHLPFRLRPGLVAEILRFYDLLRRQSQQVQRFEELIEQQLSGHMGTDPGADRMLQQTRFLAATFREYERRASGTGAVDEHMLRDRLVADEAPHPVAHVIVAVPDWIADPDGLYVADFDLLTRIPGLAALEIVCD